jgi:hypothetical protein
MEFKNYCIVALGGVDGIKEIISKISETNLRCLQQKGVFIGTFTCAMSASELKDVFDREKRTFFIFEVGDEKSAYKIGKEDIHEQLFGYLENGGEEVLNFMSDKIMDEINGKTSGSTSEHTQEKLTLQQQLEIAIEDEDYIEAAKLRDVIKLNNEK